MNYWDSEFEWVFEEVGSCRGTLIWKSFLLGWASGWTLRPGPDHSYWENPSGIWWYREDQTSSKMLSSGSSFSSGGLRRSFWNFPSCLRLTISASTPMVSTCGLHVPDGTKFWSRLLSGSSGTSCTLKLIPLVWEGLSCALLWVVTWSLLYCPLLDWLRWHKFLPLFLVLSSHLVYLLFH